MIRVICDRCGKDITGLEELGYISMLYKYAKGGDVSNCELMGMNPWEKNHYCENCMEQINDFIKCAPPNAKQVATLPEEQNELKESPQRKGKTSAQKEHPIKRKKLDYGKIKALRDAGWSVGKIAEEMNMSTPSVYQALSKIKTFPELAGHRDIEDGE